MLSFKFKAFILPAKPCFINESPYFAARLFAATKLNKFVHWRSFFCIHESSKRMKLHLHQLENQHQITGFTANSIAINHTQYAQAVIVSGQQIIPDWFSGAWSTLDATALSQIIALNPEVVLLGTGDKHRFIHPKHTQAFLTANIAVECMTTAAACRTYNILMAEGRQVVAALLLEHGL